MATLIYFIKFCQKGTSVKELDYKFIDIYLLGCNFKKNASTNKLQISESINHSDPRTTTLHYLDNFEFDSDVDVNDVLL